MVAKPGHLVGLELDRPDRALDRVGASGNEVDGLSRFQSRFGERNAQPYGSIGDVDERQNRPPPPGGSRRTATTADPSSLVDRGSVDAAPAAVALR